MILVETLTLTIQKSGEIYHLLWNKHFVSRFFFKFLMITKRLLDTLEYLEACRRSLEYRKVGIMSGVSSLKILFHCRVYKYLFKNVELIGDCNGITLIFFSKNYNNRKNQFDKIIDITITLTKKSVSNLMY